MSQAREIPERARRFVGALIEPDDEATHAACLDALEDYVAAQLSGENYAAVAPAVMRHLDSCVTCAESYAMMYDGMLAEQHGFVVEEFPALDLSFLSERRPGVTSDSLSARVERTAARLRELIEGAVDRTGDRLHLALNDAMLQLLPMQLNAAPVRGSEESGTPLVDLLLDEPEHEITRLALTATAQPHDPHRCVIALHVGIRGREWPDLAGIEVKLTFDDDQLVEVTDAFGEAFFDDVLVSALGRLQIDVDAGDAPTTT